MVADGVWVCVGMDVADVVRLVLGVVVRLTVALTEELADGERVRL